MASTLPQRPRARFYLDREGEANLLARDVGRIFLGMDLQCAQCHDHPLIADYYQADYQGLYAFFNRSILFTDKDKKVFFAEKADGDVELPVGLRRHRAKEPPCHKLPGGDPLCSSQRSTRAKNTRRPGRRRTPRAQIQPPRAVGQAS